MPARSRGMIDEPALLRLAEAVRATGYRFVTVTPATHARVLARPTSRAPDCRDIFGWSRPFSLAGIPENIAAAMRAAGVVTGEADRCGSSVRLSSLGDDLFVHSAFPTTASDAVFFGPDTYRFCAAIHQTLSDGAPVRRAVDICSGAGPGAVVIARARPGADIIMADINDAALAASRVNAALAGLTTLCAVSSNLLSGVDGDFDLIVSNPPYLNDPAQRVYRHGGGQHGTRLSRDILTAALPRLRPGGRLVLYTGVAILDGHDPFLEEARGLLAGWDGRWRYREIDPDVFGEELSDAAYADADRIAAVVLNAERNH